MHRSRRVVLVFCLATALGAGIARARDFTFADRVKCQEALERVYYSHQIGATRSFEEALPCNVLERKVTTYLKQSVALEKLWRTPVTSEMLQRETERMVRQTRMPERLRQLFGALGNDPFLVQECLARPALVDRLTHNFYAFDERFHARAREEAGRLRGDLLRLGVGEFSEDPRRSVLEFVEASAPGAWEQHRETDVQTFELTPDSYQMRRAAAPQKAGEIGPIQEERDAFRIRVVLEESTGRFRLATFTVSKRPWDEWWAKTSRALDGSTVRPVTPVIVSVTRTSSATGDGSVGIIDPQPPATPCFPDDTWNNASLDDLPEPRERHSAVWTGSEMIVWGGLSGEYLNSGGRYDPATDTWTLTSMVGAPAGRYNHTAVWTGNRMLIWGGFGGAHLNTGASYDPMTDSWTITALTGAPAGRTYHTAVWTGQEMIVWGGTAGDWLYHDSGGIYDPVHDAWTPTSSLGAPVARTLHAAVWTGNRMIVWGGTGTTSAGSELNTGGIYDPAADAWTPTSVIGAPADRSSPTAVWTGTRMIVWGGLEATYRDSGGVYDPVADTWTPTSLSNAPTARMGHTAVWTGERMIVWGGSGTSAADRDGAYDPQTDTWTPTSTLGAPSPRSLHTAAWTGQLMIVWGGNRGNNTGGRYDPATDTWTPTSTLGLPTARYGHTAVWTGSAMVIWGGLHLAPLNTGARYDPATDTWAPTSLLEAPVGRFNQQAVWTGEVMIVWGGKDVTFARSNQGGRYDPVTDSWKPTSMQGVPTGRELHSTVWTGRMMVVWGGLETSRRTNSGGLYDPVGDTWTPMSTTDAPEPRLGHLAVWTGNVMIIWGGSGDTLLHDAGRYDPMTDTWMPMSTTGAPTMDGSRSAVWTGSLAIVWGHNASFEAGAGGRYDPVTDTWMPMSTTGAPTARGLYTVVWTGSVMIMWGGRSFFAGPPVITGGRYDPAGDTWAPTSTQDAPSARYYHTAVWTGSEMIIWGGTGGGLSGSGGRYALGHDLDDDGDGLSECSGDCNDGNPAVRPGVGEVCDGLDNDCDGTRDNAPAPADYPFMSVWLAGDATNLTWSPTSASTGYDIVRGSLSNLRDNGGDYGSATDACPANDLPDTSVALDVEPPSGQGIWYLVRPINCGGSGSYDSGGPGQVGTRDASIAASASSCP